MGLRRRKLCSMTVREKFVLSWVGTLVAVSGSLLTNRFSILIPTLPSRTLRPLGAFLLDGLRNGTEVRCDYVEVFAVGIAALVIS